MDENTCALMFAKTPTLRVPRRSRAEPRAPASDQKIPKRPMLLTLSNSWATPPIDLTISFVELIPPALPKLVRDTHTSREYLSIEGPSLIGWLTRPRETHKLT